MTAASTTGLLATGGGGPVAALFTALIFASSQLAGTIAVSGLTEATVVLLRSPIALVFLTALCA